MEYKPSARSPHYGKIFAYDINGKELQSFDILETILVHNGKEYKVGKLFELVLKIEAGEKKIQESLEGLKTQNKELSEQLQAVAKVLKIYSDAMNADTIL